MFGRHKLEDENNILQGEIERVAKHCATKSSSMKEACELYTMSDKQFIEFVRTIQTNRSLIKLGYNQSSSYSV